ncbi:MAG: response regulator transcription factor [Acidobacteriia bacterium]|nr:response regulator transcription factor [Terriglobia bacterium]MBV8907241.1 response regulator transcription factor [Terriglobia bacterium]MBV9742742.1 response regulator transcription factor [Terriglobia bacterium]
MAKIRVLLTDDHTLFRQGIRTLLTAEPDIEVVGEAASASEAVTMARTLRPDVVLMDVGMAGLSSFEATRQIRKDRAETRVIFLSMYDDEDYLAESVEIGASGYILKESPAEQLTSAIREVSRGGNYLSPRLLARLVDDFRVQSHSPVRQPRFGTLTKREREILKLLAEGKSVKEVATEFDLSVKTVEAHKFNLMRKLDIHNKAQLVQYAIQKKIIRLPEMMPVA